MAHNKFETGKLILVSNQVTKLFNTSQRIKSNIILLSGLDNGSNIYIGSRPNINDGTGFPIFPGESIEIYINRADKTYLLTDGSQQILWWLIKDSNFSMLSNNGDDDDDDDD